MATTSPTRWSPFQQMERMQRDLDRLFGGFAIESDQGQRRTWLPPVDVEQTPEAMILKLDLPGIDRDAISIETHDGILTISGKRDEQKEETHEGYVMRERITGSFARSFSLPPHAKVDDIGAAVQDGVLTVTVPRPAAESPKKIAVS
ncbi:MAG TPA: Hsp20/alpha crystallin family protein [Gaiellales bacterium]|nr:Hsp20/alpha crystallin family protein [Gaiellales bacterium]